MTDIVTVIVTMNNQIEAVEEPLSLSSDIKRACELLEKLQKSKYCGEVPATKLAALQKVLQSDFLTAVREVYEHVYETVDVEGSPDIRSTIVYILYINIYYDHYFTLAHSGAVAKTSQLCLDRER